MFSPRRTVNLNWQAGALELSEDSRGNGQPLILTNKPWVILKISRRQYETVRPRKSDGMTRQMSEELLANLPERFLDQLHLEADAEKLLRTVFGEVD